MPILQGICEFHSIILILATDTIDITSAPMKNTLLNIKYWTKLPKRKKTRRKPLFAGFGLKHAKENHQHLLKNIVLPKGFRGSFNPATSISLWHIGFDYKRLSVLNENFWIAESNIFIRMIVTEQQKAEIYSHDKVHRHVQRVWILNISGASGNGTDCYDVNKSYREDNHYSGLLLRAQDFH